MAILGQILAPEPKPADPSASEPAPDAEPGNGNDNVAPAPAEPKPERKRPTGRRPLPAELPRIEIEVLPPEVERDGRDAFECIGTEVSETVERRRASLVVVRVVRPKFVRKDRERNAETEVVCAEAAVHIAIVNWIMAPYEGALSLEGE